MILDKYPLANMDTFFKQFSKEQLDRIYRYGCVSKVLQWKNSWYTWSYANEKIKELLKNDERSYIQFTYASWPVSQFNTYWQTQDKKHQPSKPEYIRRIKHFCNFALACSQNTQNEQFIQFCEKLIYEVIVGSLIIAGNPGCKKSLQISKGNPSRFRKEIPPDFERKSLQISKGNPSRFRKDSDDRGFPTK
jgi:hypothetical protein